MPLKKWNQTNLKWRLLDSFYRMIIDVSIAIIIALLNDTFLQNLAIQYN